MMDHVLKSNYSWKTISELARKHKLEIGNWQGYNNSEIEHNGIRIGFASNTEAEIRELIGRLRKTMSAIESSSGKAS